MALKHLVRCTVVSVSCLMILSCSVADTIASAVSEQDVTSSPIAFLPGVGSGFLDTAVYAYTPHVYSQGTSATTSVETSGSSALFYVDPNQVSDAIPAGEELIAAYLVIPTWTIDPIAPFSVSAHAMAEPFFENSSWACARDNGTTCLQNWSGSWSGPTYPYRSEPSDEAIADPSGTAIELDVTADVLAARGDPSSFFGWAVLSDGPVGAAIGVYMRESGTPPSLVIYRQPVGATPAEPTPPPLDRGTPTHVYDAMSWLVSPNFLLQWGLGTGVLEPERTSSLRGTVYDRDTGLPLEGGIRCVRTVRLASDPCDRVDGALCQAPGGGCSAVTAGSGIASGPTSASSSV